MDPVQHSSSEQVEREFFRAASPITAIPGDIAPVKLSLGYRLGLFVVGIVMLLLPLIYVGLIALFVYAVYYHATHNHTLISATGYRRGTIWLIILYLMPIVAGAVMTIFLIKPLFARRPQDNQFRSLSHEEA